MTTKNPITGDEIKTKGSTDNYRDGWDRIFGKKEPVVDDYLLARKATVEKMLKDMGDDDPVGKISMGEELKKIKKEIKQQKSKK